MNIIIKWRFIPHRVDFLITCWLRSLQTFIDTDFFNVPPLGAPPTHNILIKPAIPNGMSVFPTPETLVSWYSTFLPNGAPLLLIWIWPIITIILTTKFWLTFEGLNWFLIWRVVDIFILTFIQLNLIDWMLNCGWLMQLLWADFCCFNRESQINSLLKCVPPQFVEVTVL